MNDSTQADMRFCMRSIGASRAPNREGLADECAKWAELDFVIRADSYTGFIAITFERERYRAFFDWQIALVDIDGEAFALFPVECPFFEVTDASIAALYIAVPGRSLSEASDAGSPGPRRRRAAASGEVARGGLSSESLDPARARPARANAGEARQLRSWTGQDIRGTSP